MSLVIKKFVLQPFFNNSYLIVDSVTKEAVVIDPADGAKIISDSALENGYEIAGIWLTHAHFDHFCGVTEVTNSSGNILPIALHPDDLELWQRNGDAQSFDYIFDRGPEPSLLLKDNSILNLGNTNIQVLHTPGHCQGHVVYYCPDDQVIFCGDLIFKNGIGRTDLIGGSMAQIMDSIFQKILILPDSTRLLPGHGQETSVGETRTMLS
jgi:glyoxylase-like metal-dependent hydrolase (beta-lactamase superfamily II)